MLLVSFGTFNDIGFELDNSLYPISVHHLGEVVQKCTKHIGRNKKKSGFLNARRVMRFTGNVFQMYFIIIARQPAFSEYLYLSGECMISLLGPKTVKDYHFAELVPSFAR